MSNWREVAKAFVNPDDWSGPGTTTQYMPNTGMWYGSWLTTDFGAHLSIYRNSLAVRSVVGFRAENLASIPIKVYHRLDKDTREALDDHGLALTLDDPNPEATQHTFLRDISIDLDLFDCSFWKKVRVGEKLFLIRMYPDAVEPLGGNILAPDTFREHQGPGEYKDHKRDDILWLHGWGGHKGISPMESLKRELETEEDEVNYRRKQSRLGWRAAGVIQRPKTAGKWTSKARQNFLDQINSRYSGDGEMAGRPLLLEEDMTWTSDSPGASAGSEYVGARTFTQKQVCLAFNMSPQLMGIDGAPYASIVEYKNQLYQIVLGPRLHFLQQEFNKQLLSEWEKPEQGKLYTEFVLEAQLMADPATQASIAQTSVGAPWMPVSEWRAKINLSPLTEEQKKELAAQSGADALDTSLADPASTESPRPSDRALSDEGEELLRKATHQWRLKEHEVEELRGMLYKSEVPWKGEHYHPHTGDHGPDPSGSSPASSSTVPSSPTSVNDLKGFSSVEEFRSKGVSVSTLTPGTRAVYAMANDPDDMPFGPTPGSIVSENGKYLLVEGFAWRTPEARIVFRVGEDTGHGAELLEAYGDAKVIPLDVEPVRGYGAAPEIEAKKALLTAEELQDPKEGMLAEVSEGVTRVLQKMQKNGINSSTIQTLTGELHQRLMEVSTYFGKLAARSIGGEYDPARTANYWMKASQELAKSYAKDLEHDLVEKGLDTWEARLGRVGDLASTLTTRAQNWAIMEAARQNGAE